MGKHTGFICRAYYWYNPDHARQRVTLTGKRKIDGEWCYLADFGNGNPPQWIPARQFEGCSGDPHKLDTYPELKGTR